MKHLTQLFLPLIWKFGGIGLLVLGILDSSFLFAPLGNDLLVVAMSARYHSVWRMLYYAAMSTVGSVLGCLLVDVALRKAGEAGLEKHLPKKRLAAVKQKVTNNGAWALIVASIAPPPFPFTPFVMAAAALQYPRRRMLAIVGAARLVRFTAFGALALLFGRTILRWANNKTVQGCLIALVIFCTVGSVVSVYGWIKRSRTAGGSSPRRHEPEPAPPATR